MHILQLAGEEHRCDSCRDMLLFSLANRKMLNLDKELGLAASYSKVDGRIVAQINGERRVAVDNCVRNLNIELVFFRHTWTIHRI